MHPSALHFMTTELSTDRRTVRYSCAVCDRCVEDGPEGLTVIHKGDSQARHRGGSIGLQQPEVSQDLPTRPVLH